MNLTFKFVIDESKKISLVIFKEKETNLLLKELISVVEKSFPNINISSRPNYYHLTRVSNTAMFSIAKLLLEELYIRFLDDDVSESEFDPTLFLG
ncbi:hypothetical protein LCGC14_1538610 [marine sediment metagenome]|uniref:Uncharacterized protein n=1 Tax=marine sediment metagenome TaxID=412755 RepID=A0A0F9ITV1_9ZZZZ